MLLEYKGYPVIYYDGEPSEYFLYKDKVQLTTEQIDKALSDWRCDCDLGVRTDFTVFSYYLKDRLWNFSNEVDGLVTITFKGNSNTYIKGELFTTVFGKEKMLVREQYYEKVIINENISTVDDRDATRS